MKKSEIENNIEKEKAKLQETAANFTWDWEQLRRTYEEQRKQFGTGLIQPGSAAAKMLEKAGRIIK